MGRGLTVATRMQTGLVSVPNARRVPQNNSERVSKYTQSAFRLAARRGDQSLRTASRVMALPSRFISMVSHIMAMSISSLLSSVSPASCQ